MSSTGVSTIKYQFAIQRSVPFEDINEALDLALIAVQSTEGTPRLRLDLRFVLDDSRRTVHIDAGNAAGQRFAQIFTGLLEAAHGPDAFRVERSGDDHTP